MGGYRPAESSLLRYILAGVLFGTTGAADHVFDFQVLYCNQIVVQDKCGGGFLYPVPAPIRLSGGEFGYLELGPGSAVGAFLLPGALALQSALSLCLSGTQQLWHLKVCTIGSRYRRSYPHIQTNQGSSDLTFNGWSGLGETYVPTVRAV